MKLKMSDIESDPQNLKLKHLLECFYILGIIESQGIYLTQNEKGIKLTYTNIVKLLDILFDDKQKKTPDYTRRIKTARSIFNSLSKDFIIKGRAQGVGFEKKISASSLAILKRDKAYTALLVIFLSLLYYKDSVYIDFFKQLLEQDYPIHFLTIVHNAIENKLPIRFEYTNRKQETHEVDDFVPVKLRFKDGHWMLVGWDQPKGNWNQYMIHSIKELKVYFKKPRFKIPEFKMEEYLKHSFGHAVLNDSEVFKIEIRVPLENSEAVQKRNQEGEWKINADHCIWTVYAYDPDEVINYVFRWNGCLEIISPESIRKKFLDRLKAITKMYEG
ncbi:MAG: WYL domain-containing protein [Leptospiraceae bacterium]|nr:WYL domain-containing protein [Leptospiraceae bacterium]